MKSFFRLPIFISGIAMGAADVVPGVSGGTIALITGIYEELLKSISSLNWSAITILKDKGFWAFWKHINGSFLFSLFLGIGLSIVSLSRIITVALENYPIYVWSFFFGLVLASAIYIGRMVKPFTFTHFILMLLGFILAFAINMISPAEGSDSPFYLFFCGALAVCAMILPGISGSLILLILGAYNPVFSAIADLNFKILLPVILGAIIGLALFSKALSWLFDHYKTMTLAVLTGFMVGALGKVWPWKEVLETYVNRHGEMEPLVERNVLPGQFTEITGQPALLGSAILFALFGFFIVFIIEHWAKKYES